MTPEQILVLQHHPVEGAGLAGEALTRAGLCPRVVRIDRGESVPGLGAARGLLVMGGPMGVYESHLYPHLRDELRLIESALREEVPVVGVCLGSQLLAAALGARVYPSGGKEIGLFDVELREPAQHDRLFSDLPPRFPALHWHGDVFDLPSGAVSLARSERTEHQAFRHGERAWGLLFHLEADVAQVDAMSDAFRDELSAAGVDGDALRSASIRSMPAIAPLGHTLFAHFARLVAGE